jgi:hypothetical protein
VCRVLSVSSLALALTLAAWAAGASEEDDKRVCLSTYVEAQSTRQEGKLGASQRALEKCGAQVCPGVIRNDCVRWLREVTDAMPTVVLSATGSDGRDVADVRVSIDGQPLASHLDGRPMPVDPGEHLFRFDVAAAGEVEQRVLVREGEKDRAVVGTFPRSRAETEAPSAAATSSRSVPASVWVLGGVGAASFLVSATFASIGWFGAPGWSSSQSCRPSCSPGDVNTIKQHFVVADIAGGVAIVSLGAAAYLFFARPVQAAPVSLTFGPHNLGMDYARNF